MTGWADRWLTRRNAARFILVITVGLIIGLFYPQQRQDDRPVATIVVSSMAAGKCLPTGKACMAVAEGLSASLQLPAVVPVSRPFRVRAVVSKQSGSVSAIEVAFAMKGMDMGVNRYRLVRKGDHWESLVVLPVCTTGRTDWIVRMSVSSNNREYRAEFPFVSGRAAQ